MRKLILFAVSLALVFSSCAANKKRETAVPKKEEKKEENLLMTNQNNIKSIYLAGGCFWGVEGYFSGLNGVVSTNVGYANGKTNHTSYYEIEKTDHSETVEIIYDYSVISLEELLLHYFRIIDPKSLNKQGNDRGRQYRTGVYYVDSKDLETIDKVFAYEERLHNGIVVEKSKLEHFIQAEEYHQDYLAKNPNGYCHIDLGLAKKPLFKEIYSNPEEETLKSQLDPLSYSVLRESATERPFSSPLNDEYRKGIYIDKITKEPLFSSKDKFESGCGWPSFSKPILSDKIQYLEDSSHGMNRIETRSSSGDNHLGHVFNDGPKDKGGLRYCINGASLEFIPFEEMDEKGYSEYKILCE